MSDSVTIAAPADPNFKPGVQARMILDSISPDGVRLSTMEWTFHRFILAEVNTHRVLSRNSASSRAIPVEKQLARVLGAPAWPVTWPAEQRGMQGGAGLEGDDLDDAQRLFEDAHGAVTSLVQDYLDAHPDKSSRLHKSLINRLLEPFMWHTAIITATDWGGVWWQRCHRDAQPEFQAVARVAEGVMNASEPRLLHRGEWHMPYLDQEDHEAIGSWFSQNRGAFREFPDPVVEVARRVSSGRCARVSYLTHDGRRDVEDDLSLFDKLTQNLMSEANDPWHASPLEHVATPAFMRDDVRGNLTGWHQFRHIVEDRAGGVVHG